MANFNPNARQFDPNRFNPNGQQQQPNGDQQQQSNAYQQYQQPGYSQQQQQQYPPYNQQYGQPQYGQQQQYGQQYGASQQHYQQSYGQQPQQAGQYAQYGSAQYFNPNQQQQPQFNPPPSQQQQPKQQQPAKPKVSVNDRNKAFESSGVKLVSNKPAAKPKVNRPNLPLPGEKPAATAKSPTSATDKPLNTNAPNAGVTESDDGSWEDLVDDKAPNQQTVQSIPKSTSGAPITLPTKSASSSSAAPAAATLTPPKPTSTSSSSKTSPANSRPSTPGPIEKVAEKMSDKLTINDDDELTEEERKELAEMDGAEEHERKIMQGDSAKAAAVLEAKAAAKRPTNFDIDRPKTSAMSAGASGMNAHDTREHINIVFIGHVDAGKSTISGQIIVLTGQIDERTVEQYKQQAVAQKRESWFLAYVMDTNDEERAKGKTVEVGRAHFDTTKKRYTLLDAPGHKNYVPNMIGGAQQADVGILVISARKGEFEAGFDKGGQTREHAQLAKTLGLAKLIVLVNKMDDPSVQWAKERFDKIYGDLSKFLKQWGFKDADVTFIPCSGYTGENIKDAVAEKVAPWYTLRKSLFQVLDDLPSLERDATAPLRLPVMSKFKDMGGVFAVGKIESGTLMKNTELIMTPTMTKMTCTGIEINEVEVDVAKVGENVLVKLKGVNEEDIMSGYVLSYPDHPGRAAVAFDAQIRILELLETNNIMAAGYQCVMHVHSAATECYVSGIINGIDPKTGKKIKPRPKFAKDGDIIELRLKCDQSVAIEPFDQFPQLGRFTLRDAGRTIAIGKVLKLVE